MKTVALLTGRGNNTLTDKNVLDVLGKPLLYYAASAAKASALIDDYFVSSEDRKILDAARGVGYKEILRPEALAQPESQHVDCVIHALGEMRSQGVDPDLLIVILANCPTIKTEWIDACIETLEREPDLSSVIPVHEEMDHHPLRAKKLSPDGLLLPAVDAGNSKVSTNRQDLPKNYFCCHNFWALRISNSIDKRDSGQLPWTFMGNAIKPLVVENTFDIHTKEDLDLAERWLRENRPDVQLP